ncbi:MAG: tetratricopeptide repeat protein [Bacteroidota bacterium]
MKNSLLLILLFVNFFFSHTVYSQKQGQERVDSLLLELTKTSEDSNKVKQLNSLSSSLYSINLENADKYANQAILLAQKISYKKGEAAGLNNKGYIAFYNGKYKDALSLHEEALKISKQINDKKTIAVSLNYLGIVYRDQGDYSKAMNYYFQALKFQEELKNKPGIASALLNIGVVYSDQDNFKQAIIYQEKALLIFKETNDIAQIANTLTRIGNIYWSQKNYKLAQEKYSKALELFQQIKHNRGIAVVLNNIAGVYTDQNKYKLALDYYFKALEIRTEIGDKNGIAILLGNIGSVYTELNELETALEYYDKSIKQSIAIGYKETIKDNYLNISKTYEKKGNYKKAYEFHTLYSQAKDSLINDESNTLIAEMAAKYDTEKKEAEIKFLNSEKEKESEIRAIENRKKNTIIVSIILGLLIVIVFSIYVLRLLKNSREQKLIIEEHQKEIIDSITYAKRIQLAILPSDEQIKKTFPTSFVLYKPKAIVAGDFYWMEQIGETIFIAAADSTGHGVPGAMVSVVCSNALNRAVNEFNLIDTGNILDKTRELVLETFAKSGEEIKDGMDISLLSINKTTKQICWSGANNPLWYILNSELKEIKPDKQSIGKTDNPKLFTTHNLEFKSGTVFYLITDGYADQFGGEKGKKYKYKPLQEKLLSINNSPLDTQKEILEQDFNQWKGNLEQIDDVTIIGIKI